MGILRIAPRSVVAPPRVKTARRHRKVCLLASLVASGLAALVARRAGAQTIDPGIFGDADGATRSVLAFLGDLDVARHAALGDMLFVFNTGVLALAGFLLVFHAVAGTLDTAREGRPGIGAWEIVRIVAAVALMAPLPGGMNGAQRAALGLAALGGDFANAIWRPFSEQVLGQGAPIVPRPKAAAWRSAIARTLLSETCAHVANAGARAVGDDPYVRLRTERSAAAVSHHYDGGGQGMPKDMCGVIRFDGLAESGSRGIAAHGHRRALEGLFPALGELAAEFGDRFVPGSQVYGRPLPDLESELDRRGLADAYAVVLDAELGRAATAEQVALQELVAADAAAASWLAAAGFFNTVASRTGLFQTAVHNVPDAALPLPGLEDWSPQAAAAVKALIAGFSRSSRYQPVFFSTAAGVTGSLPAAAGGDRGLADSLFAFIDLDATIIADGGNPVADLAGFGHDLIAAAMTAIVALSGAAAGSGLLESIPFFGKGLDVFEAVWRVTDSFVSLILGVLLIAGIVLAYVLPALPFIRFLFGIFGWLLCIVEAVLAVTILAAAHVTREDGNRLAVRATRQGWLFLPALVLRPPLMLFGLILGYFVFLAAIGLFNDVWLPQLRDAARADGLGPIGFLTMLTLYVMIAFALMNGAFRLIDRLPEAVLGWIGAHGGSGDAGGDRLIGTAIGGISRLGALRAPRGPGARG